MGKRALFVLHVCKFSHESNFLHLNLLTAISVCCRECLPMCVFSATKPHDSHGFLELCFLSGMCMQGAHMYTTFVALNPCPGCSPCKFAILVCAAFLMGWKTCPSNGCKMFVVNGGMSMIARWRTAAAHARTSVQCVGQASDKG